jgi:hypothetical protein
MQAPALPNDIIYAIALEFTSYGQLLVFSRICRQFASVVDERRADIYSTHSEVENLVGRVYIYTTYDSKHRDDDQPAVLRANGTRCWYQHGLKHRGDGKPAKVAANGTQIWYWRGLKHRDDDQPAIIFSDGTRHWYQYGLIHAATASPRLCLRMASHAGIGAAVTTIHHAGQSYSQTTNPGRSRTLTNIFLKTLDK